jgi:hypothetical protein
MGDWRKSTYSDATGGNCVEIAASDPAVLVRDTQDQDGVTLSIPAATWHAFTDSLR